MMFSHLCTARPSILWEKFKERYQVPEISESDTEVDEEDRCELEKCTFCDYRVCCQVTSSSLHDWETKCLAISDLQPQVTDNPAYGLLSENWLVVKRGNNDDEVLSEVLDMDSLNGLNEDSKREYFNRNPRSSILKEDSTSQQRQDCDVSTVSNMNKKNFPSVFQQTRDESRFQHIDDTKELPINEHSNNDQTNGKLLWSVLRHRGDILKNCDNKTANVVEKTKANENNCKINCNNKNADPNIVIKAKKNIKDRSFPLSLMRPIVKIGEKKSEHLSPKINISTQRIAQKYIKEKNPNSVKKEVDHTRRLSNDILGINNPLSEIAQIKTEESIQEWLARISESSNGSWTEESEDKKQKGSTQNSLWDLSNNPDEETNSANARHKLRINQSNSNGKFSKKSTLLSSELTRSREKLFYNFTPNREELDTADMLSSASKASPVHVPMVVMQCSRLHLQIGGKPPFQQSSLPMGTLVTALYQESEWLYIQTPHGIEGFVSSSNCAPIGTVNEPTQTSRKPWEPCDFPIQVKAPKLHEFNAQGSYILTMLPDSSNFKEASPLVNTVKMKANFYNDKYLPNQTFKIKDSIKTAKTVTDILRNSPDTNISNL